MDLPTAESPRLTTISTYPRIGLSDGIIDWALCSKLHPAEFFAGCHGSPPACSRTSCRRSWNLVQSRMFWTRRMLVTRARPATEVC